MLHVHREIVPGGKARGGGLAILHRDSIAVRAFDLAGAPRPTTYERQIVRIVAPSSSSSVVVVNIYRPPSALISSFIDELDDLLGTIISDSNNKIILCGDFNCPGLDETHIDNGLLTVLESYGLQLLVHEPTRGGNILDILASDNPGLVSDVLVDEAGLISDHRLIHFKLRMNRPSCQQSLRDIQLPAFESALRRSCLFASPEATVDAFTSELVETVTTEFESVAPLKTSLRRQSKPITKWLSKEAAAAKRERRRLEKN